MDYKEQADRLEKRYKANETGSTFVTLCSRRDVINAASAITSLLSRTEEAEKIVDEYAEAARAIALWLSGFCNKELPYPSMISDAARKISTAYADMENRAQKAEKERDSILHYLRSLDFCLGCKGCEPEERNKCTEENDRYEFGWMEE